MIARPFMGEPGAFTRTANRHDYAVPPPKACCSTSFSRTRVDDVQRRQDPGRFLGRGIARVRKDQDATPMAWPRRWPHGRSQDRGLIFVNLVDFDMLYGHRNDVEGYARALEEVDTWVPEVRREAAGGGPGDPHRGSRMRPDDAIDGSQPRIRAACWLTERRAPA